MNTTEDRVNRLMFKRYQNDGKRKSRLLERVREEVYLPDHIEEDCICSL